MNWKFIIICGLIVLFCQWLTIKFIQGSHTEDNTYNDDDKLN